MRSTSAAMPVVAEDTLSGDAVEGEHPERCPSLEPGERVLAGDVGRFEDRAAIAFHDPDHAPLGDGGNAVERAVREVGAGDEADLVATAAAEPEGVRHGEMGEGLGVVLNGQRVPRGA